MPNRELFARPNVSSSASAEGNRMAFLNWSGGARFDQHLDAEINIGGYTKMRQSTGIIEVTLQETPRKLKIASSSQ